MGMKSPLRILACVLATLLLTPSLFGQKADFIFVNRGDVGTLDPNRMSWMQDIRIGYALWEGLYALDPDSLNPIPGAAEKIDLSEDKLTYTFHLRDNGKWSKGTNTMTHDESSVASLEGRFCGCMVIR